MESVRSYSSTGISLPRKSGGSAPALVVSGPARCLLRITACRLAKSPKATLYTGVLQRLCCLRRRSDCFRVERTSSRAGFSTRGGPAPFTAHRLGRTYFPEARSEPMSVLPNGPFGPLGVFGDMLLLERQWKTLKLRPWGEARYKTRLGNKERLCPKKIR